MAKISKTLWLESSVVDQLQKMADRQGITLSALVDHILKAGLDSTGDVVSALEGMSLSDLLEALATVGRKMKPRKK